MAVRKAPALPLTLLLSLTLLLALALLLARLLLAGLIALLAVLQIAEGIVGQTLLIAQGFPQTAHCLIALLSLPLTARTLHHLHVFHQLTQHLHQFLRFGGAALFHQLFQFVQHLLQLIARHLHAVHVLRKLTVWVSLGLFSQFTHVIIQRLAHFLHQFVDLFGACPVSDRLIQTVLRALQGLHCRGKIPLFHQKRDLPQFFRKRIAGLGCQAGLFGIELPDNHAQAKVGALVADEFLGFVGHRLEDLRRARGVFARPEQIAPHLDQRGRQRIEKALARQDDRQGCCRAVLTCGIRDRKLHGDRQVRKHMLRQIVDQCLGEFRPVARYGHRQIKDHRLLRLGGCGQTIAAVHGRQIEGDRHLPCHHAVIVTCCEILLEAAIRLAPDVTFGGNDGGRIGKGGEGPRAAPRPIDGNGARLGNDKAAGGGICGIVARNRLGGGDRLRDTKRPHLAIQPELQHRSDRKVYRLGRHVVEVKRRLSGVGRRLCPAFPSRPGRKAARAAGGKRRNRRHPPQRPEQQGHDKGRQGHIAQSEWVTPRKSQVRLNHPCLRGTVGHPRQMSLPDGKRSRILPANRLTVRQSRDRTPRQTRIKTRQSLGPCGRAKAAKGMYQGRQSGHQRHRRTGPDVVNRKAVLHPKGKHGKRCDHHRPKRPEGTHNTLGPETGLCHAQGHADPLQNIRGVGYRHAIPLQVRGGSYSHAGMVSRERISSKVGRARMTAK